MVAVVGLCLGILLAGTGGWFDSAPGTPLALGVALPASAVCWLRMAALGGGLGE